jgi:hypothetical protein
MIALTLSPRHYLWTRFKWLRNVILHSRKTHQIFILRYKRGFGFSEAESIRIHSVVNVANVGNGGLGLDKLVGQLQDWDVTSPELVRAVIGQQSQARKKKKNSLKQHRQG